MNYEEFKKAVTEQIKDYLPDSFGGAEITLNSVTKNNDQKLTGLMIKNQDSNICPNIYLESFFTEYKKGKSLDEILKAIAEVRVSNDVPKFDVENLTDFDRVKERITVRLVNAEKNADYLADKPHTKVADLAATYHILISRGEGVTMTAPITNNLMEGYGVDNKTLHKIAKDNMDTLTPATFKSMTETMVDMMMPDMMRSGMSEEEAREAIEAMTPPTLDEQMYVLSNKDKVQGASALLDESVMDAIVERIGQDFYILPSSVHEVLIVPKVEGMELSDLTQMVREINASVVSPEEILSDQVYAYDARMHELYRADKAAERAAQKETEAKHPSLSERLSGAKEEVAKQMKTPIRGSLQAERG